MLRVVNPNINEDNEIFIVDALFEIDSLQYILGKLEGTDVSCSDLQEIRDIAKQLCRTVNKIKIT